MNELKLFAIQISIVIYLIISIICMVSIAISLSGIKFLLISIKEEYIDQTIIFKNIKNILRDKFNDTEEGLDQKTPAL